MNIKEKATILHYHRHREETFEKGSTRALGWKNDHSQQVRYEMLVDIGDLNGCSVLDPGCGYGDFLSYLDERFNQVDYTGLDLVPEFLEEAAHQYAKRKNCRFYLGDFSRIALPRVDYVLASGAFGYKTEDLTYVVRCIDRFYRTAEKGIAFNMLEREKFPDHPLLTGHRRDEVMAFCNTICPRVECIDGYLEDDFTVFMHKS
ncbi:class I SAM-dependent methyltransferase [Marinilabiliaceae bacterium JC017]|nr:class I SAM-dependent methyltransferase [Marinilabiliaceae bacterium JC017]